MYTDRRADLEDRECIDGISLFPQSGNGLIAESGALVPVVPMVASLRRQLAFGIARVVCFCLGTGKNAAFIGRLNAEYGFFERVVPLEHPRYIMQYKRKEHAAYVRKYVSLLGAAAA